MNNDGSICDIQRTLAQDRESASLHFVSPTGPLRLSIGGGA